jgi:hypothetical protein
MHSLLQRNPATQSLLVAAAALLLLAVPFCVSWLPTPLASRAGSVLGSGGGDATTGFLSRRVDVLIPYSPDDRGVFLTDDPSRGALASVLRYVSDLRAVSVHIADSDRPHFLLLVLTPLAAAPSGPQTAQELTLSPDTSAGVHHRKPRVAA